MTGKRRAAFVLLTAALVAVPSFLLLRRGLSVPGELHRPLRETPGQQSQDPTMRSFKLISARQR